MINIKKRAFIIFNIALLLSLPLLANADVFPLKTIRLVVPYSPGGGSDIVGRAVAKALGEQLGQSVVVENKPGGSATIGSSIVAKSKPDGYTLLLADSPHAINAAVFPKLPYRTIEDFTPISMVGETPLVLVVNPKLQSRSFREFSEEAKRKQLNLGSGGNGTLTHLVGVLMKERTGLELTHVPFKGTGQAISDVVAGHIESMISTTPGILGHVSNGTLRALAVTGRTRSASLPETPTFAEAGLPGFVEYTWYGVFGPAGMPADVVTKLNQAMTAILNLPALRQRLQEVAVEPLPGSPSDLNKTLETDVRKWSELVAKHKITLD